MAESSRANRKRRRVPEQDIFLSHSGEEKPFVEQLFHDFLQAGKHPFFDQDRISLPTGEPFPPNIVDAAEQCEMGVVVLSKDYLTSYWPMVELNLFVDSNVRLYPLFFKLKPSDLRCDEVESTWKPAWRDMGMKEEVVESWGKAVKAVRISNGLEFAKYSNSEHKYRLDAVRDICKQLPPILKSKITHIQGYERLCKTTISMFEGNQYLGLYGMAGAGKSTLCKAMCNYNQGEFGANVYRVELTSDQPIEHVAGIERLGRLKHVLQLMGVDKGILELILIEEQGWEQLKKTLGGKSQIFLAIDNVGNSKRSIREAQLYLEAGFPVDSKVLVTSRSRDILEVVLGCREYCKPLPRLERKEALELFLSIATPKKLSSSFDEEENKIVECCLDECQFADSGYNSAQFHPLILKALGSYFHDVDSIDVVSWKEALENNDKLQRSDDAENVNYVLGLNYKSLGNKMKLIYLDTVLYPHDGYAQLPWWGTSLWWYGYDAWVSWISEVHDVTLSNAKMMLKDLQRLSLLEDSISIYRDKEKPHAHDLYKEYVRGLVEQEGTLEWKWWMSQEEMEVGNEVKLKRLVLKENKSVVGRPPKKLQEWRSLVFLEMNTCNDFGLDNVLDIGGLNKLRVLVVEKCSTLKSIICTCGKEEYTQKPIEKERRDHCRGCMRELLSVKLEELYSLEDISFLRHCRNIETLRVLYCNGSIYPSSNSHFEKPHAMDLSHLKKLHTLIVWEDMEGNDVDTFSKWLCKTLQLQKLGALEYVFCSRPMRLEGVTCEAEQQGENNYGAITISLGEDVSTSNLSVLSMCLPRNVEEIQGLQFLSNLTTLNFNSCGGLRKLPNLKNLLKLKEVCFGGCPLGDYNKRYLLADFLPQNTRSITSVYHGHDLRYGPGAWKEERRRCFECRILKIIVAQQQEIEAQQQKNAEVDEGIGRREEQIGRRQSVNVLKRLTMS